MPKKRKSKRPTKPQKCIFCKSPAKVTGEHLLSRRFHRLIPPTQDEFRTLQTVEHVDHSTFEHGTVKHDPRHWKIKCVCEKNCNNGWMRELERQLDPILEKLITGKETRLSPNTQEEIATWAVMKAMVIDHIDDPKGTTHHMQRCALYTNQRPPQMGWVVWLGHHPRAELDLLYRSCPFLSLSNEVLAKRSTDRATYYNASAISYVAGKLFVQVIHGPEPAGVNKWTFPIFRDGGVLRRIWPKPAFDLMWPPYPMSAYDVEIAFYLFRNSIAAMTRAARYPETL